MEWRLNRTIAATVQTTNYKPAIDVDTELYGCYLEKGVQPEVNCHDKRGSGYAATRNGDVIGGWRFTIGRVGTKLPPSTKPKAEDGIERGVVPVCPILLLGKKTKKKPTHMSVSTCEG